MTEAEALTKALAKIASPENWTQHAWARDSSGASIWTGHPDAECWCGTGAVMAVSLFLPTRRATLVWLNEAAEELHDSTYVTFNDDSETTHAEVVAVFRRAIELAEAA